MREEGIDRIEVHVAGICIDGDKVLLAKRSSSRNLYPGLWECGGGHVKHGENFVEACKRQLREELGVVVEPVSVVSTYEISPGKIPGVKFLCHLVSYAEPRISEEHTEWRWQPLDKLDELELIPGLKEDILGL
ncbi:MAG: NUDIX domain-containing protein [Candidatus Woesearchaeota archaeon]